MKKFGRIILPAIMAAVALTGCKFDGDYDLTNVDMGDIQVGEVIEGPLGVATFHIDKLTDDLDNLLTLSGVDLGEWNAGEHVTVTGFPQEYTTDPIDIDLSLDEDIVEMLTENGELQLFVLPNSSLTFTADLKIVFGDEGGAILDLATVSLDREESIDISAEDLEKIAKSKWLWINIKRGNNGSVSICKDDFVEFKLSFRKTGGIKIGGDKDEE